MKLKYPFENNFSVNHLADDALVHEKNKTKIILLIHFIIAIRKNKKPKA